MQMVVETEASGGRGEEGTRAHEVMVQAKVGQHGLGQALALVQLVPLQLLLVRHPA